MNEDFWPAFETIELSERVYFSFPSEKLFRSITSNYDRVNVSFDIAVVSVYISSNKSETVSSDFTLSYLEFMYFGVTKRL